MDKPVRRAKRTSLRGSTAGSSDNAFLVMLEKLFEATRPRSTPPYPYDQSTNKIELPPKIEKELLRLLSKGNKVEAVKRVTRLTGAGLRVSKDYVDDLKETRIERR